MTHVGDVTDAPGAIFASVAIYAYAGAICIYRRDIRIYWRDIYGAYIKTERRHTARQRGDTRAAERTPRV